VCLWQVGIGVGGWRVAAGRVGRAAGQGEQVAGRGRRVAGRGGLVAGRGGREAGRHGRVAGRGGREELLVVEEGLDRLVGLDGGSKVSKAGCRRGGSDAQLHVRVEVGQQAGLDALEGLDPGGQVGGNALHVGGVARMRRWRGPGGT
jgi:hypothetical protein